MDRITSSASFVPHLDQGIGDKKEVVKNDANVAATPSASRPGSKRESSFNLDRCPEKQAFMFEFLRGGMAHVVHEKKSMYWNACDQLPSLEQREKDAKSMAEQFGIPWEECMPEYPQHAKETFDVLQRAASRGQQKIRDDKFALLSVDDNEKRLTHIALFFKPLLREKIARHPDVYDLPESPTAQAIDAKIDYLTDPKNFLKVLSNEKMKSYMLFDDPHSIDQFAASEKMPLDERAKKLLPINDEISKMAEASAQDGDRTVSPNVMLFFEGGGEATETAARNCIQNANDINHTLSELEQKAKEKNPDASFPNVVFNDTMRRLFYPSMLR